MAKLEWHNPGEKLFETGIDRGVLFVGEESGVAWNGLISVDEKSNGSEPKKYYYDGINYRNRMTSEEFEATLTAYYSPPEFDRCDGMLSVAEGFTATQQKRRPFHLSYRTRLGNDIEGSDYSYKIHFIYNALAAPSDKSYSTIADSVSANSLSWDIITKPYLLTNTAPSAHFILDASTLHPQALENIENELYGNDGFDSRILFPEEIRDIINNVSDFIVIDNGDGTFTMMGTEEHITIELELDLGDGVVPVIYTVNADSVIDNGDGTFTASSL